MIQRRMPFFSLALLLTAAAGAIPFLPSSASKAAFAPASASSHGGLLLQFDFNGTTPWPETPDSSLKPVGTVDVANTTAPSGAMLTRGGVITSGLLPVRTTETNLGKLTLSFDHSVSIAVHPVIVQIESFDAKRKRTGGREGIVYPAAPDFFLRAPLELSTLKSFGTGAFRPTDPFIRLTFKLAGAANPASELRIDNVAYASPAFYVGPNGSDQNDGRTEKTAFADPQKAVDAAQPGDIILLMDGTYHRAPSSSIQDGVVAFRRAGTPAAWIALKNYPGQHPVLTSDAWNTIKIGRGTSKQPSADAALAYLEVRGLHIRGNAETIQEKHPELIDKVDPLTNGNGISGSGGNEANIPHHLRFADNLVEYCSGGGIGTGNCDWVTIENNTIRNNCWWVIYATSGAGFLGTKNFDAGDNIYKMLIRNNRVSGNRCFRKWKQIGKISDGNGIIIDTNYVPAKNQAYLGRTLIQNNLSFNNGGSGIHAFRSHRVDIINNTAYYNGASPELNWGQIFVQNCDDMRMMNNILVSRPGQPINSVGLSGDDQNSTNIVREYNLYFGGLPPKLTGSKDEIADPLFVKASTDFTVADFHLRPGSPALKAGRTTVLSPILDLDGKNRPVIIAPDKGAYQR